jgi:hypothetical protein
MDSAAIAKRYAELEKAEAEYKAKKEMMDDALRSDAELVELEEKVKEARRAATIQKEVILNEPSIRKNMEQLKEMALEIKDIKKLLGDELIAYFMHTKELEYTTPSGEKKRIVLSAKLSKGGSGEE